ncbi:hypothetical protein, partial [Massilia sp. CFBP 13721]
LSSKIRHFYFAQTGHYYFALTGWTPSTAVFRAHAYREVDNHRDMPAVPPTFLFAKSTIFSVRIFCERSCFFTWRDDNEETEWT